MVIKTIQDLLLGTVVIHQVVQVYWLVMSMQPIRNRDRWPLKDTHSDIMPMSLLTVNVDFKEINGLMISKL